MKIASISARAVDAGFQGQSLQTKRIASPMSRFARFANERSSWMWPTKKTFVRIETDDGLIGWSCTNGGEVTELIVNAHLSRLLLGENAENIDAAWEQMAASLLPNDRSGFAMMAVAAIDIALWDLRARAANLPLVEILGGTEIKTLSTYATTTSPETKSTQGWYGLKAAAPYGPEAGQEGLAENIALLRRFRDAAGPNTPVMIDAFMSWDADYALRFAEAADDLLLGWIEDPLPPNDTKGMEKLRRELDPAIPLALGNFAFSLADCEALIELGLPVILQPDVAWAGGITETLRILDRASAAGVPVILHNSCEQPWALAIAAAVQDNALVEFVDRGATSPLYELISDRPKITNGQTPVPCDPDGNRPFTAAKAAFAHSPTQGN